MIMKRCTVRRVGAVALSVMMFASGFIYESESNAAIKPSIAKKATVKSGKSVVLTIKTNGFTIKRVTAKSTDKSVATVKATKKALTVKGIKPGSTVIKSTMTVKNGKNTKKYSFSTRITVTGEEKREISLADFVGEYRRLDYTDMTNPKPDLSDSTKSTLTATDDGFSFSASLVMATGDVVNIGPIQIKDSDMTYKKEYKEATESYSYTLKYTLNNGGYISFERSEWGGYEYWLGMDYKQGAESYLEAMVKVA